MQFSSKSEIKYFLGIDGGGTKTEFLLTDIFGKEIKRILLGPSNPVDIGIENTVLVLSNGINLVCDGINYDEVSVFAGIAGSKATKNKIAIKNFLKSFGFAAAENGGDIHNSLAVTLKDEDGIVVIMGTGMVALAKKGDTICQTGGWGYLFDKGASGYDFGCAAIENALKFRDGRQGSSLMCELVEKKLGKTVSDSIPDIYKGGKHFIASFAPIVFEAFEKGDGFAREIIDRNVKQASEIINACAKNFTANEVKTVITGGMCSQKDILGKFFSKYLSEKINLEFSVEPAVYGAVLLAKNEFNKRGASKC